MLANGSLLAVGLALPFLLLLLMLAMERVERPLRRQSVDQQQLASFLDTARPDEVETYVSEGFSPALERYWRRRRLSRLLPGRSR